MKPPGLYGEKLRIVLDTGEQINRRSR